MFIIFRSASAEHTLVTTDELEGDALSDYGISFNEDRDEYVDREGNTYSRKVIRSSAFSCGWT